MATNNEQDAAKAVAAKKAAEDAAANKKQTFVATFRLLLDGSYAAPSEKVKLSREQYETLKRLGAIEGDWK
ncbi:hypothetical protein IYW40_15355 [Methylocystis sp. H4A]|uniref:hypothetical protein n=1 Tax=Methylocystis sp. H4A TaxID=2785788 RepID=UPI0018C31B01|nr:hypothetical protein [Methylocystis sp. H4A]MBG0802843.1 hypothetical protein [Methylocystis sp. H4A]